VQRITKWGELQAGKKGEQLLVCAISACFQTAGKYYVSVMHYKQPNFVRLYH